MLSVASRTPSTASDTTPTAVAGTRPELAAGPLIATLTEPEFWRFAVSAIVREDRLAQAAGASSGLLASVSSTPPLSSRVSGTTIPSDSVHLPKHRLQARLVQAHTRRHASLSPSSKPADLPEHTLKQALASRGPSSLQQDATCLLVSLASLRRLSLAQGVADMDATSAYFQILQAVVPMVPSTAWARSKLAAGRGADGQHHSAEDEEEEDDDDKGLVAGVTDNSGVVSRSMYDITAALRVVKRKRTPPQSSLATGSRTGGSTTAYASSAVPASTVSRDAATAVAAAAIERALAGGYAAASAEVPAAFDWLTSREQVQVLVEKMLAVSTSTVSSASSDSSTTGASGRAGDGDEAEGGTSVWGVLYALLGKTAEATDAQTFSNNADAVDWSADRSARLRLQRVLVDGPLASFIASLATVRMKGDGPSTLLTWLWGQISSSQPDLIRRVGRRGDERAATDPSSSSLSLFVSVMSYGLLRMHDTDVFDRELLLPRAQLHELVLFLRDLLYRLCWVTGSSNGLLGRPLETLQLMSDAIDLFQLVRSATPTASRFWREDVDITSDQRVFLEGGSVGQLVRTHLVPFYVARR